MAPNKNPPNKPPPKSKANNTTNNNNALYKQKKGRIAKAFPKSYKNKAKSYEFMMMHREQQQQQQQQQKMNDTDDDKNDDEDVAKEQDLMMKTSDDEKKKKDDDDENDEKHYVLDLGEMQRRLASERNTTNTRRSNNTNNTNKRVGYQSAKGKRGGGENNKPERKLGGFRFSGRGDGAQRVVFLAGVALRGEKEESGEFGNEVPGMV